MLERDKPLEYHKSQFMKTSLKYITYPLLAVFLFTAVPALCCCMDVAEAGEPASHQTDVQAVRNHDSGHHDHGTHDHHRTSDKSSSHDHSQCEHPQLIGTVANSPAFYFGNADVSFRKLSQEPKFIASSVIITDESSDLPHDHGPPGNFRFSSTPLYLQISVLLI